MTTIFRRIVVCNIVLTFCVSIAGLAQTRTKHLNQPTEPTLPTKLVVDATQAPEKILHARLEIPVTAGELKLVYPEWIPGEHGPTGPVVDLTGLKFFLNGRPLAWRRDLEDMYMVYLTIPEGGKTLEAPRRKVSPQALQRQHSSTS
jgi:hypothetical protein